MTTSTVLQFTETVQDGSLVYRLRGALDTTLSLDALMESAVQHASKNVILVLTDVEYLNSAGFGGVVRLSDALVHCGKTLYIAGLEPRIHLVFSMVGAHNILNVVKSVEVALDMIQES